MRKGRRKKVRFIQKLPSVVQFSPRGRAGRPDEVELSMDQYEALKLADHQGYHQSEGGDLMGISRPSFGRILRSARKTLADAIINGKIIRFRTGDVQVGIHKRDLPFKRDLAKDPAAREELFRSNILKYKR